MPINQPSNQIKLTNVSIVRLKTQGKQKKNKAKTFEIACYKNKVEEWRKGVETNIDDVLQISAVFMNVSKGEQAKAADLKKYFDTSNTNEIIKEILDNGDFQAGEKEREHNLSVAWKDIVNQVTEMVVDPATQQHYSSAIVEKALNEVGFSVDLSRNVKSQVLAAIKSLQQKSELPIQRARMRVRIVIPIADLPQLEEKIREGAEVVDSTETREEEWETILQIDPAQYRIYKELLDKESKSSRLDILERTVSAAVSGV